jgi:glycosyltransferase involved in cell wall biosynthesis
MLPGMDAMPWLSIVVPVYRRAEEVRLLLGSLPQAGLEPEDYELVLVDDASGDGTPEAIGKAADELAPGVRVRVVELRDNGGPARARNAGAHEARGRMLFFTDSDCLFEPGALAHLKTALQRPGVRALSGYCSRVPANEGFFPRYKGLEEWSWLPRGAHHTFFPGRHAAIERELFLELGGFSAAYRGADVEDYEVGYRIRERTPIHFDPAILVRHHHPTFRRQCTLFYRRARMWMRLFLRRGGQFDNTATTPSGGASRALGPVLIASAAALPFAPWLWPASAALLAAYAGMSGRFFGLCLRHEGAVFTARAFAAHLVLSCYISAGAAAGLLDGWRGRS